ncbi:MAG TPA: transposase, partial [Cyanobacteria bacterium UBA11149]|nr:transposase [Cyanobacteria bacterium UBA11149]
MQLAERHIIKSTEDSFAEIDELAFKSKNLYNAANYVLRQNFLYGWGYLTYKKMASLMKSHPAYQALPAKVSQQILMVLDKNWQGFFESLKAYKNEPTKFTGCPKLPKYKDKVKGRNLLVYTVQAISSKQLKKGIIKLSGTDISIKTTVKSEKICQVRVVPKCDCYIIEVIYNEQESTINQDNSSAVASIDL